MGAALFFLRSSLGLEESRVGDIWTLCLLIPVGVLVHFIALLAFGFPEARNAASRVRSAFRKFSG